MKRKSLIGSLIVLVLCLTVCLSIFAACSTQFDADTLEATLRSIELKNYQTYSTPSSYELERKVSSYNSKQKAATIYIKWTIEDTSLITITEGKDTVTVNVLQPRAANIYYKLRATLTDEKGKAYLRSDDTKYTIALSRLAPGPGYNENQSGGQQGGGQQGGGQQSGGSDTPTTGNGTLSSPYTVAQALGVINGLTDNATTQLVYVKGVISDTPSKGTSGSYKFDIVDSGSSDKLTVYYAEVPSGTISNGDTVVVSGALKNYTKDGTYYTKEITYTDTIACKVESINSVSTGSSQGGGNDNPDGDGQTSGSVTFDFTSITIDDNTKTAKSGNITVTLSAGTNTSNGPKTYTESLRMYCGNTMKIEGATIVRIEITFSSTEVDDPNIAKKTTNTITASPGTLSSNTWTGSASSVTFTIGNNSEGTQSGHRRFASMTVYFA